MKHCDHCNKSEQEQGNPIDCEVWGKERDLLLCDDCFFNEEYKNNKEDKINKSETTLNKNI